MTLAAGITRRDKCHSSPMTARENPVSVEHACVRMMRTGINNLHERLTTVFWHKQ